MVSGTPKTAMGIGAMVHVIGMGAVVFGIGDRALFSAFDNDAWWLGATIGMVHGLKVGAMAMPMMPLVHPRMEGDGSSAGLSGGQTVSEGAGDLRLAAPRVLGSRWGRMTPVGILMGHVLYGTVLILVYGWGTGA